MNIYMGIWIFFIVESFFAMVDPDKFLRGVTYALMTHLKGKITINKSQIALFTVLHCDVEYLFSFQPLDATKNISCTQYLTQMA